jgi:hypothetical protein
MALVAAVCVIDLLPNGMYNGIPSFLAGALAGLAAGLPQETTSRSSADGPKRLLIALEALRVARGLRRAPGLAQK